MEGLFFPKNFGKRTRQWIWKNQSCFSWMGRLPGDGCSPGSVLGVAGAPPQGDIPGDDPAGRGSHGNPVDADVWSCPLQPPAAEVL